MMRMVTSPIDVASLRDELVDPAAGAYAAFEGWIRNVNEGQNVLLLESSDSPGGLAARREFHPGFKISTAPVARHFSRAVARDLGLASHGLNPGVSYFMPPACIAPACWKLASVQFGSGFLQGTVTRHSLPADTSLTR